MKKRILSVLITLVMLIGLVTVMSISASAAEGEHTHCLCGEAHASVGDHDAEVSTTFTAVTNQAELQNAATNGGNVYLANNIMLTTDIIVAGNLNLCLNGYSITPAGSYTDGRAITVNIGATFVLTDCGDGSISGFMTSSRDNGTGVYNEGTFTMYAGAIGENSSNGNGGGVYNSGTFTMYGGTIRHNELTAGQAYGRGAGVYQKRGSFTMYGGTITRNKTVNTGGGVYYSGGTFTMYGGTISENWANSGGGVYGNYFAMHGGSVINNTATAEGGGIHNYNGTLELSGNVTITGNVGNEGQSDIFIGYTVITIKEDFAPTSAIGVRKDDVIGTIARAADGETLDIEDYKQYFVGEEGIPVYAEGNALELGYIVIEEPDDTNNHTVKTNSDANASYQWAKYGLIAYSVVYYESYGPMSLRSVALMPGMEDAFGIKAARVDACGYWDDNTWVYYANYDAENKYWIASNNVLFYEDANDCSHEFDASYFIIVPAKNGTLSVTLIDPLADGQELALYIMDGEGYSWPFEEVTPNADGSYSLTAGIPYRLLIKDSDDTNNGTYEEGFNDTFPKLTATFTAMGAYELLDGQNEATLDITGLGSGAYLCKTSWDIYDSPEYPEDDYYLVSVPVTCYDVIFDYGTLGSETKTVFHNETVTPPAPVFAGKVLVGWYTDSNFTTEFNFSDAINADNITVYAKFADYEGDKTELNNKIDAAKSDLQAKIDAVNSALAGKADAATVTAAMENLQAAIDALEAVKNDYATADATLKAELEAAIADAESAAISAAETLVNNAKAELQSKIDAKADAATTTAAIQNLQAAVAALEAVKDDYATADATLKTELEGKIANAQTAAISAAETLVNNAKAELQSKIDAKADAATTTAAIQNLQAAVAALEAVKDDYATADATLKTELEGKIETAKSEAITAANTALTTTKNELSQAIALKADTATLNAKVDALNTAIATAETLAKAYADTQDAALKSELETVIATAKSDLEALIGGVQSDLDTTKAKLDKAIKDLNKAITDGDEDLSNEIAALNTALTNAKAALEKADADNKAELVKKIEDADASLQAAIDKVASDLTKAQKNLADAIATGDASLSRRISSVNTSLSAAKTALEKADADNKAALEAKIEAAEATLDAAIKAVQKNLDDAKAELNKAIADGDTALDDKISALNEALATAKVALEATDRANKSALITKINEADATLTAAIDALSNELNATNEKVAELETFIIIVCVISGVAFCGCGTLAVFYMIDKKKKI